MTVIPNINYQPSHLPWQLTVELFYMKQPVFQIGGRKKTNKRMTIPSPMDEVHLYLCFWRGKSSSSLPALDRFLLYCIGKYTSLCPEASKGTAGIYSLRASYTVRILLQLQCHVSRAYSQRKIREQMPTMLHCVENSLLVGKLCSVNKFKNQSQSHVKVVLRPKIPSPAIERFLSKDKWAPI